MTHDEVDFILTTCAEGDVTEPRLLQLFETQFAEDLAYLRAEAILRRRYTQRLLRFIIRRVEDRGYAVRDRACQRMVALLPSRMGQPFDAFIRECATLAFVDVYVDEQEMAIQMFGLSALFGSSPIA